MKTSKGGEIMERLTERGSYGYGDVYVRRNDYVTASKKLCEYEDLEEQGLLLRLPCKVGSPLYRIYKKPTKCTAYGEYRDDCDCLGCEKECDSSYVWDIRKYKTDIIKTINCLSDEIGKTVFLTQKEAEQKLKEMEQEV